jgi:LacI family transcriptional regulator
MASEAAASGRVTISDVARAAGVSTATVSRVLNDKPDVRPEVRDRVLSTIERLNYRPNAVARGLRSRRSKTIAILTGDIEGLFTGPMMRGVEDAAATEGVGVFLCNSYGEVEREREHLRRLLDLQVDGVIMMSGSGVRNRSAPALPLGSTPYVFCYDDTDDLSVPSIHADERGGARLAVEHLAAIGRTAIGIINGPAEWKAPHERLAGFREGLAEAQLPYLAAASVFAPSWQPEDGYTCMQQLLEARPHLDAVFCASDDLATGALAALHDADRRIPEDIAIVGFDDRSLAVHQRPPLTTVGLPLVEMGRVAGRTLLRAIDGDHVGGGVVRIPCSLVVRASTTGTSPAPAPVSPATSGSDQRLRAPRAPRCVSYH